MGLTQQEHEEIARQIVTYPISCANSVSNKFDIAFLCNPIQLLAAEISSDATPRRKNFSMNNSFDCPLYTQHDLLWTQITI